MSTRLHQCPSGMMLQVTEPEPGVLKAVAVGDEGLVARAEVRGRSPYERANAEYEIALWCDGERQNPVRASYWSDVLPKVCEFMSLHAMRGKTGFPVPSTDDRRAHLQKLFELMSDRSPVPQPRRTD